MQTYFCCLGRVAAVCTAAPQCGMRVTEARTRAGTLLLVVGCFSSLWWGQASTHTGRLCRSACLAHRCPECRRDRKGSRVNMLIKKCTNIEKNTHCSCIHLILLFDCLFLLGIGMCKKQDNGRKINGRTGIEDAFRKGGQL